MKRFNHLTIKQLKELKEKIIAERDRILESHKINDEKFYISKEDQSDEVDLASTDYENSHMLRLRNREIFYVRKLNNALKKFSVEEYGFCEECGAEIKFQRLLARPTAELCILCKEESERDEQNNVMAARSKSYSDAVNLAQ
ncbi:MAG: TraR/DksA C4-type zinc finger protein [Halobacteriovoraceae bacterium]|nr:TraR/DksA C4-type zinc finger protein [Halobacteriovoraceae bacterium]